MVEVGSKVKLVRYFSNANLKVWSAVKLNWGLRLQTSSLKSWTGSFHSGPWYRSQEKDRREKRTGRTQWYSIFRGETVRRVDGGGQQFGVGVGWGATHHLGVLGRLPTGRRRIRAWRCGGLHGGRNVAPCLRLGGGSASSASRAPSPSVLPIRYHI